MRTNESGASEFSAVIRAEVLRNWPTATSAHKPSALRSNSSRDNASSKNVVILSRAIWERNPAAVPDVENVPERTANRQPQVASPNVCVVFDAGLSSERNVVRLPTSQPSEIRQWLAAAEPSFAFWDNPYDDAWNDV